MIFSRSTHVAANGNISFFLMADIYINTHIYICPTSSLSIHLSMDTDFSISLLLQIVLLWTLWCMHLFKLQFSSSPDICPGIRLLENMGALFLVFWRNSILFSIVAAPIYVPTNNVGGFPFLHTLSSIICRLFGDGHSDEDEVIPHCSSLVFL